MVQTRSGENTAGSESHSSHKLHSAKDENTDIPKTTKKVNEKPDGSQPTAVPEKRKRDENGDDKHQDSKVKAQESIPPPGGGQPPPQKAVKADDETERAGEVETEEPAPSSKKEGSGADVTQSAIHKIRKTVEEYGSLPLQDTPAKGALKPIPETLLAMVLDAMLKSTRISHDLAQRALIRLIEAGYHDIKTLSATTWDDRVQVLSEGGYNRYRERTATHLGELVELINEKYDGDLNNLLKKADSDPARVRELVKEIKGLGDLATDLFADNAQAVWPALAPSIDARSLDTAEEVGIGRDVEAIFAELDRDPVEMSRLARGLSTVRLAHKQRDIEEEE